jgi:uncharacterized protein (TIGR02147 family)
MARGGKKSTDVGGRDRPALRSTVDRQASHARLLRAVDHVPVVNFLSYRDYMQKIYEFIKDSDPTYSYAQLGEDLGFSRSNVLWLVIVGRRKLSPRACERLIKSLGLTGSHRRYLEQLRVHGNARRPDERQAAFDALMVIKSESTASTMSQHTLEYFSEWHHPVLREMVALPDFQSDPDWINDRLVKKLMPTQILKSLELLERLDLITYDRKRGRHVQTGGQIKPDRHVERMASVRFHQKMCDMARDAATRVSAARRDMNTLTICVSDATAMKASEILFKACEQIMKLESESDSRDQIYQVNVHLFPFTKTPKAKE